MDLYNIEIGKIRIRLVMVGVLIRKLNEHTTVCCDETSY